MHPVLSNLLPEGSLRELIALGLKVHVDNEFQILAYLGEDLPGAIVAEPMEPDEVPESVLTTHGRARVIRFDKANQQNNWFALSYAHFEKWAEHADVPWRAVKPHLDDVMEKARALWLGMLKDLPMHEAHKRALRTHWEHLHKNFQLE